jgi:alanyl-tRNA synthetase
MKEIDHRKLKKMFFDFFRSKKHAIIKDFSIVPEEEGGEGLFILAGMHPLIPYLMGKKHKDGKRIANCQRCIRTVDIDKVGDEGHNTFFEMLGNWSLGDYFKKESIEWSYEFLTSKDYLNIPHEKLWVTVFKGNKFVGRDEESIRIWKSLGIDGKKIVPLGEKDNWWAVGDSGPCGPDTEIFVDMTGKPCGKNCKPGICDCGRFVEIWNNVFMCYNRQGNKVTELSQKNVDTGMGLERTLTIVNNYRSGYETSVLRPILEEIVSRSKYSLGSMDKGTLRGFRILTDHLRASVIVLGDVNPTIPSNHGRGYVLRRLIRRSLRFCKKLGIESEDWIGASDVVIGIYGEYYPELEKNRDFITKEMKKESERFSKALGKGLNYLTKMMPEIKKSGKISRQIAFRLYDTFGFPIEITREIAEENGWGIDVKGYEKLLDKHKEKSRSVSERAKSGLVEKSRETIQYHTLTHLLQAALREVLGKHVDQKGSNINRERLRFDFSHDKPMTKEEISKVEAWVQDKIDRGLKVSKEKMTYEKAIKSGAIGLFGDRYAKEVTVYSVGNASKEICIGPHVSNTSEIKGRFKIKKEESVSAGIRRIRAVLE